MKKSYIIILSSLFAAAALSGCSQFTMYPADVYTVAAQPYRAFTEEEVHSSECRIEFGDEVSVNGQGAWFSEKDITISEGGIYIISGAYDDGCISITTTDPVKLIFDNASIANPNGCAVHSAAQRLVISSENGSSSLTGSGEDYNNAIYSEGDLLFVGSGELSVDGSVFSVGGIQFGHGANVFCEILRAQGGYVIPGSLCIN